MKKGDVLEQGKTFILLCKTFLFNKSRSFLASIQLVWPSMENGNCAHSIYVGRHFVKYCAAPLKGISYKHLSSVQLCCISD